MTDTTGQYDTPEDAIMDILRQAEPGDLVMVHHGRDPERAHEDSGACWCKPEVIVVPGRN